MISASVIQSTIMELKSITKIDLCVMDTTGVIIATTISDLYVGDNVVSFVESIADSQTIGGNHYVKVLDEGEVQYVLVAKGEFENVFMIAKIAACQIQNLIQAYKERVDKQTFFQNLILDNLLLVDIYNRAKKLNIPVEENRIVYLVEINDEKDNDAMEMLKNLFPAQNGNYITSVDESNVILIKNMKSSDDYNGAQEVATMILDMMSSEAMISVSVSYGTIVNKLKDMSKSYKEAKLALDVAKIFYAGKRVIAYNTLGIGRLIYQLPINLCQMFIREVFNERVPEELDEEILQTIDKFFENNLNVSETARQLFIHRNTLVYRIEKLQKATGLDIRVFEDALTFKIALMVVNYMNYLETK